MVHGWPPLPAALAAVQIPAGGRDEGAPAHRGQVCRLHESRDALAADVYALRG
jgi:hypothetical protein